MNIYIYIYYPRLSDPGRERPGNPDALARRRRVRARIKLGGEIVRLALKSHAARLDSRAAMEKPKEC